MKLFTLRFPRKSKRPKGIVTQALVSGVLLCWASGLAAQEPSDAIFEKWSRIFQPSAISVEEQIAELKWFAKAAKPFRGKWIRSAAEDIKTHYWERDTVAKAFEEITGIHVEHEIIGEGTLVQRIMEQQQTGKILYDIFVNDADMVGTHLRFQSMVNLSQYMQEDGKPYTNPRLDLEDFLNLEFGQDYDGNQLQLPDQQFANLYWFRYDWFTRPEIRKQFKARYGYDLGVPVNWAAYEDIAQFFTGQVIDGQIVYGHLDYGKKSPSLGWRFTDAWFSIAGVGDRGLPNGLPVDEWGIRVRDGIPVGSSVERGGATNSPAAVYALRKYIEWLDKYAPPQAKEWRWVDAGPRAAQGNVAQRIFQYTTWLSDEAFHRPGSPVVSPKGELLWRVAPTPRGRYWDEGMKVGYQDAGSWTIPKNVKGPRRAAAWLWAQFCVSKTLSLKKFLTGNTPVRKSTIFSEYVTKHKKEWGGMIEFYRSPEEKKWTGTGLNVPHYAALSAVWWSQIAQAIQGERTPQQSLDVIAKEQDRFMHRMQLAKYSPQLNPLKSREHWLALPGSPKPERPKPKPQTIPYDELIEIWAQ